MKINHGEENNKSKMRCALIGGYIKMKSKTF